MNSLRRRKEEAWQMLGALGWPQELGDVLGGIPGGASDSAYGAYITSLNPLFWLRMRETSGTAAANSGSAGAAANGVIGGTTALGQTGQLGANEAFDYDASTSEIVVPNVASLSNMTTQRWYFLCHPDTLGEGSNAALFEWGAGGATNHRINLISSNNIVSVVRGDGGASAVGQTSGGAIAAAIGVWTAFFMDYDDLDTLALGRKTRMWMVPAGGAVTAITMNAANTALTGSVVAQTGNSLYIGNRNGNNHTFDGLFDEAACWSGSLWDTTLITTICQRAGLIA